MGVAAFLSDKALEVAACNPSLTSAKKFIDNPDKRCGASNSDGIVIHQ